MIISLKKNEWLYDWMQEKWHKEFLTMLVDYDIAKQRPNHLKRKLVQLLETKGFKAKLTSNNDIIISMPDEQYTFLKLKYE